MSLVDCIMKGCIMKGCIMTGCIMKGCTYIATIASVKDTIGYVQYSTHSILLQTFPIHYCTVTLVWTV